jgi:hypothetical protein
MPIDLLPVPKKLTRLGGHSRSEAFRTELTQLTRKEPGAYHLRIDASGTLIRAADEEGFFYAAQTLAQIDSQFPDRRPCLDIVDWPDFPVRGFYHDVTRGKVPTLETLLELADTCAHYKLNHLELYIEHTYAFRNHPEVWKDASPLTADEIRALDEHCARLHIDLVPSFSTFGHFYTWIHRKFPELNELERDVSGDPFSWRDRMAHYTLDCRNPRSFRLVKELLEEVLPLFRSRHFNICCDETFDLGKGRNKALADKVGVGRLYVDFLKKIMSVVRKAGKTPLFWGDVIGAHPEVLSEVPRDAIALDWDYSPTLRRTKARLMAGARRAFYVCPGVSSWNRWLPDYTTAHQNITAMAKLGRETGATGFLNTDWGDYGHINTLGPTLPGLILGACCAWTATDPGPAKFDATVSRLALGDPGGRLAGLLRAATHAVRADWRNVANDVQRPGNFQEDRYDPVTGLPHETFKWPARDHAAALRKIAALEKRILSVLSRPPLKGSLLAEEIAVGLLGLRTMEEYHLLCHRGAGRTKSKAPSAATVESHLRELDRRLAAVWRKRNKPSEYYRIREVFRGAVRRCRQFARMEKPTAGKPARRPRAS